MRAVLTVAQWMVRVTGVVQLLLGLLFWTGDARGLVPLHMILGILLVLALWLVAGLASQAGAPNGLALGAAVTGLILLGLGLTQDSLLPGGGHWLVQVLHLLTGLAAVGAGEALGARVRRARLASA